MGLPHRFGRCHRQVACPATDGCAIADERLVIDEHLLDINRAELVKTTRSKHQIPALKPGNAGI